MVRAQILVRVGHGTYRLSPQYKRISMSVAASTETLIADFLRREGGVASTKDIHSAVWDRKRGDKARPSDYRRVRLTLSGSPLFRQDYGRGFWNLPPDDMARLPLPGRWAAASDWQERKAFFVKVGAAFSIARGDRGLASVAQDRQIGSLLEGMVLRAGTRSMASRLQREDKEAEGSCLPPAAYVYWLFEQGHPRLHMAARAIFYVACARLFGVDAVRLSRGR